MATENGVPPVRGGQETATTANGSMPIADLECPCCGDVGARADLDGFFHDGDRLVCGCYGWVTADGETLYISGTGDEPCPKCEPSAPVRAEAAKAEQRSIVLCPQCQSDMPRERHDRGLFPASMAEWCDRCLPAFSPLLGKSASPVREAELRRDVDVALSSLSAARLLLTNGDHADALEELDKGIAQVKPLLLAGLREAEPLKALVAEAVELLKHVRVLDCGAHYCRYCPAKSPEWEHTPSCPYEESQVVNERARVLRQKLSAALEGAATKGQP